MFIINTNFFHYKETISTNLVTFMRLKGYTRLSLSKLVQEIPRPAVDLILSGKIDDKTLYNAYIRSITKTFNLSDDYFMVIQTNIISNKIQSIPTHDLKTDYPISMKSSELFVGLEIMLDIYSMYID